jgi:hypothetical protein
MKAEDQREIEPLRVNRDGKRFFGEAYKRAVVEKCLGSRRGLAPLSWTVVDLRHRGYIHRRARAVPRAGAPSCTPTCAGLRLPAPHASSAAQCAYARREFPPRRARHECAVRHSVRASARESRKCGSATLHPLAPVPRARARATHSSRWGKLPAADTSWSLDSRPDWHSRIRTLVGNLVGLPCEPGRGLPKKHPPQPGVGSRNSQHADAVA